MGIDELSAPAPYLLSYHYERSAPLAFKASAFVIVQTRSIGINLSEEIIFLETGSCTFAFVEREGAAMF